MASSSGSKAEFIVGGKYKLVRKIGSGSFGDIYLAINITNGEVRAARTPPSAPREAPGTSHRHSEPHLPKAVPSVSPGWGPPSPRGSSFHSFPFTRGFILSFSPEGLHPPSPPRFFLAAPSTAEPCGRGLPHPALGRGEKRRKPLWENIFKHICVL